jgi:hypothetical protein
MDDLKFDIYAMVNPKTQADYELVIAELAADMERLAELVNKTAEILGNRKK